MQICLGLLCISIIIELNEGILYVRGLVIDSEIDSASPVLLEGVLELLLAHFL